MYCKQLATCIGKQLADCQSIEFILVDDGSTDETLLCLNTIQNKHPQNVKVISKPNGGVSSARNKGIEIASGEWIGFLDSDDIFAPNSLKHLIDNCISTDFDMIEFKERILPSTPKSYEPLTSNIIQEINTIEFYSTSSTIVVWKLLYRREYLIKNNIRFRDICIGEDGLFNFDACMAGGQIRCVDTIVIYHIDHPGSLTTSTDSKYIRTIVSSVMYAQKTFTDYLNNNHVSDAIHRRIRMHKERQIRFVFRKIIITHDISVEEIKNIRNQFLSFGAFPIYNAKWKDTIVNYLFNHPRLFKFCVYFKTHLKKN